MKIFIKGQEIALKNDLSTVYKYKGSLPDEASLPTENNAVGDVYNCEDTGNNFAWTDEGWDKLSGTIDLSNYYTKSQADSRTRTLATQIADEKIAAIPVNDLLHYKGHYASLEDLPSTGQPTGQYISPSYDYLYQTLQKGRRSYSTIYRDYAMKRAKYYFVMALPSSSSTTSDKPFVLYTDYPEQVRICFCLGTSSTGYGKILPQLVVTYDPNKPVYWARNSSTYEGTKPTEALLEKGTQQITSNSVLCTWTNSYSGTGMRPDSASDTRIFDYCNFPYIKLDTTVRAGYNPIQYNYDTYTESRIRKSIRDLTNNFIWTDGMTLLRGDENGNVSLVYSESMADENDLATVGEYYDLYRCNDKPTWEKLSGGTDTYTKEEIDNMIGDINTALTEIVEGGE